MAEGVGERLREARRARGLSLAEVEATTRIKSHLLAALEAEAWERLPGEFYTRAFLREYAVFLDLDPEEVLAGYRPAATGERPPLPRQIKAPPRTRPRWSRPARWQRPLAGLAALAVIGALVAVAVSSLGGGSTRESGGGGQRAAGRGPGSAASEPPAATAPSPAPRQTTLTLTATAEVWVCLLDRGGSALVDGQILAAGAEAGPFRSRAYTLSLGNGSVEVTLDGRPAPIPPSANPVGFAIEAGGRLRELPPEERPTCT